MYMIIKNILYYQKETIDRVEMHFIEKEPGFACQFTALFLPLRQMYCQL